ncbi:hypothetical protein VNO80_25082 [Phaseolus coccineus]|uniref:Uncharacterized protein n=1 Tax=Phaseolus coccineus TaxID=3886 RepID=A0AAN9QNF5_PHACN
MQLLTTIARALNSMKCMSRQRMSCQRKSFLGALGLPLPLGETLFPHLPLGEVSWRTSPKMTCQADDMASHPCPSLYKLSWQG